MFVCFMINIFIIMICLSYAFYWWASWVKKLINDDDMLKIVVIAVEFMLKRMDILFAEEYELLMTLA